MNKSVNLEPEEPAFGRPAEIGAVFAEKPHSTVSNRLTERNRKRIDYIKPL